MQFLVRQLTGIGIDGFTISDIRRSFLHFTAFIRVVHDSKRSTNPLSIT